MNFHSESCLAVPYSMPFQPLVAQQLLIFNKSMLPLLTVVEF